jgi:2-amino-4-hydroxy-6-hydroxymethyldihydropteridine diphosphokinase
MRDVAYVALGSNLGDRAAYLAMARAALTLLPGVRLLAASRVEETIPLGSIPQGPYLNQMVALHSAHAPLVLLDYLQDIERRMGRRRAVRWGPRVIDLDIVRMSAGVFNSPRLVLPHPGLEDRDFWQRESAALDALLAVAA